MLDCSFDLVTFFWQNLVFSLYRDKVGFLPKFWNFGVIYKSRPLGRPLMVVGGGVWFQWQIGGEIKYKTCIVLF